MREVQTASADLTVQISKIFHASVQTVTIKIYGRMKNPSVTQFTMMGRDLRGQTVHIVAWWNS
jgi:hypothetical protein